MTIAAIDPRISDPMLLALAAKRASLKKKVGNTNARQVPQNDDELWDFVQKTWGIEIPRTQICPNHSSPFNAFADAYFARDSMVVWEASRGLGGKSFLLSLLGLTIACTRGGDVNILGGSGEQARRVHEYMAKAWGAPNAPRSMLRSDPLTMITRLSKGNKIQALLGSPTSVRGPHIPTLLLDEVDEFDLKIFDAAMGQTMAKDGCPAVTVMSSTHHYPDGTMTEVKKRAKEKGWLHHAWCYRESLEPHGWLKPTEVTRKKRETTIVMWDAEYELQEPSPESRAIDPDAVNFLFKKELGHFAGKTREYIEIEEPQEGATYSHGADWAKKRDFTEIITFRTDVKPLRLVAYERMQRLPWPVMVPRLDARIRRFGGRALFDQTGLGDVIDGYLEEEADGFIMTGRPRTDLFNEFINACEKGEVESPYIESLYNQLKYVTVDDLYGEGHPPDGFVGCALGYRASRLKPKKKWRFGFAGMKNVEVEEENKETAA